MQLPLTPQRQCIDDITAPAIDRYTKWSKVGKLPGFEIIDRFSNPSDAYTCFWYIFQGESWYKELEATRRPREIGELLLTTGISFLAHHGYARVSEPQENAIVAYQHAKYPASVAHYARLVAEGRVRSKFGSGYVYEHPLDFVPNVYGDQAVFLMKGVL